ncbi:MAG: glycyl-radical enzyme activating protein [Candidatus Bathyarchaeia archaeon]|nr:glycyl-radical enzyme activating protein [Candidatus Bathyarchaeota archaeon]
MNIKGTIFNIQRFCLDDGPGIRTTVFLKGCPLRCLWCCNPEGQNPWPELAHRDAICTKCGRCIETCPKNAISISDNEWHINRSLCNVCGKCVDICVRGALGILGREMSVDEVFKEVIKDLDFYEASGGGVTLSGGEPLFQPDFAADLLKRCKDEGIHTAIETSGYSNENSLKKVLPYVDLILYDLKCISPELHKRLTGVSNDLIIRNLRLLISRGVPVIIRFPLIPTLNDSDMEIASLAEFIEQMGVEDVEVLPYHRLGISKYRMLGRKYELEGIMPPTSERLQAVKRIFELRGLRCKIVR